jgi:23S rRNA (adenine2503-C2)-methyltransferase
MGMGEPMLNFDNVLEAARRLPDLGITHRRTTISTIGWLPGLQRFVDEVEEPIRLALSLHAADPALRSTIMPVNDRYPLPDVLAECVRYFGLRRRKVFVEYVMLDGVNDQPEHARELATLLRGKPAKLNLIPFNPFPGTQYRRSPLAVIEQFRDELVKRDLIATIRKTRGDDIDAACGQLAGQVTDRTTVRLGSKTFGLQVRA